MALKMKGIMDLTSLNCFLGRTKVQTTTIETSRVFFAINCIDSKVAHKSRTRCILDAEQVAFDPCLVGKQISNLLETFL